MTIDLYYLPLSAPCRSIMMLAQTLGIELNLKRLDLFAGEHLTPEFLKVSVIKNTQNHQTDKNDNLIKTICCDRVEDGNPK